MWTRLAILFAVVLFGACAPGVALAASAPLEISGWVPYWRSATGTADVLTHLSTFTEVDPFGFEVQSDGTIYDPLALFNDPWASLVVAAKAKHIRIIPTVMWSDTNAIHNILSDTTKRVALEDTITSLVTQNGYDGIDIDFEGKKAEDKNYFSTFLKGLYMRMGQKWVMCSIEARTPVSDRYDGTPPADAMDYANDYTAINKYCDRVRIMAYDQGTIDVKLNDANAGPYAPLADPAWVRDVINLAAQSIPKRKLVLGIPTYGYEYSVTPLQEGYRYNVLWTFNPKYALTLSSELGLTATRNSAGELSFSYLPGMAAGPALAEVETTTQEHSIVPTMMYSNGTSSPAVSPAFNVVWWSDAKAIAAKVALARSLGLRGVAIFKIDGGEDPGLWSALK